MGIRISNVWKYRKYPVKKQYFREQIATPVCALVRNDIVFRQSQAEWKTTPLCFSFLLFGIRFLQSVIRKLILAVVGKHTL